MQMARLLTLPLAVPNDVIPQVTATIEAFESK
jgi:hypothetical protein